MAGTVKQLGKISNAKPFAQTLYTVPSGKTALMSELTVTNTMMNPIMIYSGAVGSSADSFALFGATTGNAGCALAIASDGTIYQADPQYNIIRKIATNGYVTTFAGSGTASSSDGTGTGASFNKPSGICLSSDESKLYVVDNAGNKVREVVISSGVVTTIAGDGTAANTDATGLSAQFLNPRRVILSADGTKLYISCSGRIREMVISTGVVSTLAGATAGVDTDGTGAAAILNTPTGMCLSSDGTKLYYAETNASYSKLKQIVISTGVVTTLVGSNAAGGSAGHNDGAQPSNSSLSGPYDVALDSTGDYIFIADYTNNAIRRYHIPSATLMTVVGDRTAATTEGYGTTTSVQGPLAMAMDSTKSALFVQCTYRIVQICPFSFRVSYFGGGSGAGNRNGLLINNHTAKISLAIQTTAGTVKVEELLFPQQEVPPGSTIRIPMRTVLPQNTVVRFIASGPGCGAILSGIES